MTVIIAFTLWCLSWSVRPRMEDWRPAVDQKDVDRQLTYINQSNLQQRLLMCPVCVMNFGSCKRLSILLSLDAEITNL